MRASELAAIIPGAVLSGGDGEILSLKADSRAVGPGDAFIALKGSLADGHRFIPAARERGAALVICEHAQAAGLAGPVIAVPDTGQALLALLPALYPGARRMALIGVTGTSGKTSTTFLIESILKAAGRNPGVIGTIDTRYAGQTLESSVTTPGPLDLFERLDAMQAAGVDGCVMEVSSHALDQGRIAGLTFACACFMNLSLDHLDYHKDMRTYFEAKRRLFTPEYLAGTAVINQDDLFGKDLIGQCTDPITFGQTPQAMIRAEHITADRTGIRMQVRTPAGRLAISSPLLGAFQVSNILAAIGVGQVMGIAPEAIAAGIAAVKGIPGRMEAIPNAQGLTIVVDYAHKPEALEKALLSARALTAGRLITVFGCGGDRDRSKRPIMGEISTRLADITIVTSDNPRSEDPQAIIDAIVAGIEDRDSLMIEPDRARAIKLGIATMHPDDCLIIAGKGHETYQIIGATKIPFDDKAVVRACLEEGQ